MKEDQANTFYKNNLVQKVFYSVLHENMLKMASQREKIKKSYNEITHEINDKRDNVKKYQEQKLIDKSLQQNLQHDHMISLVLPKQKLIEEKSRRKNINKRYNKADLNEHPVNHIPTDLRLRDDAYKNKTNFEQIRKLAENSSNEVNRHSQSIFI